MPWYQSKYAKAALVAVATGAISAIIIYLGIIDDVSLTGRQIIKIVGLAFMAPFATLVRFLPSFQDIFSSAPQVNAENVEQMTVLPPADAPPTVMPRSTK